MKCKALTRVINGELTIEEGDEFEFVGSDEQLKLAITLKLVEEINGEEIQSKRPIRTQIKDNQ